MKDGMGENKNIRPPEFVLLCACCSVADGRLDRIADALKPHKTMHWPDFVRMVRRHRVSGLVCRALENEIFWKTLPQETRTELLRANVEQVHHCTRLALETQRIYPLLSDAGICARYPKGLALTLRLYGDVTVRHYHDVDVFVPRHQIYAAYAAMIKAGYVQTYPGTPLLNIDHMPGHSINFTHPKRGLTIELHWQFDENPLLVPCPEEPPACPVPLPGDGGNLPGLNDTDLICYLALHGASHSWMRLKWLADMAVLLPRLQNLPEIIKVAKMRGMIRPLAQAIFLTRDFLSWQIPPEIAKSLPQTRAVRAMVRAGHRTLLAGGGMLSPKEVSFGTTRLKLDRLRLRDDPAFLRREWAGILKGFFAAETTPYMHLPRILRPLFPLLKIPLWLIKQLRTQR